LPRIIPVSSRFFTTVAAHLDAERPTPVDTTKSPW